MSDGLHLTAREAFSLTGVVAPSARITSTWAEAAGTPGGWGEGWGGGGAQTWSDMKWIGCEEIVIPKRLNDGAAGARRRPGVAGIALGSHLPPHLQRHVRLETDYR